MPASGGVIKSHSASSRRKRQPSRSEADLTTVRGNPWQPDFDMCDNEGAFRYTAVDVGGHSLSLRRRFPGVRVGPDKAEVSGSSPLRPTKVTLTRYFTVSGE